MKKKVLSLLVVAVLLISVLAVCGITASADGIHQREKTPMVDGVAQPIYHCTCGYAHYSAEGDTEVAWYNTNYTGHVGDCKGSNLKWIPTATLPTGDTNRYYLTGNVTVTEVTKVTLGKTCRLDLNGYTVSSDTAQVYTFATNSEGKAASSALVLTDSWGGGTMELTGTINRRGGILGGVSSGKIYIYRGTYDASQSNNTNTYGASVINATGTVYMYGGTMKGGSVKSGGAVTAAGAFYMYSGRIEGGTATSGGGSILIPSGTAYIYGGTVTGGKAPAGGNIRIWDNGKLYVGGYEGSNACEAKAIITQGEATSADATTQGGGNIMADKKATIAIRSGSEISFGKATNGGNISVIQGSETGVIANFTVSGGEISHGEATRGGNIYMYSDGTLNISGGTITEGDAPSDAKDYHGAGGNIFIRNNGNYTGAPVLNMTGGQITNGEAGRFGGNVYLNNLNGTTVSVIGGEIRGGDSGTSGGNVYMTGVKNAANESNLTISGIIGKTETDPNGGGSSKNGGNLYLTDSKVELTGSINGGTSTGYGGSVCFAGTSTLNMSGTANINGGTAGTKDSEQNAGNVFINGTGTLNMSGSASITGGHAYNTAGNVQCWGTLSMTDTASISGGITGTNTTVGGTANIQLADPDATLEMSGTASIPGGVQTYNNPSIVLSGTPTLGSLTDGLTIAGTTTEAVVNAAGMTGGQLVVQVNTDTGVEKTRNFATIANEGQLAYILSEDDEYKVMADGTSAHLTKKLVVIEGANGYSQDYITLAEAVKAATDGNKIVILSDANTGDAVIDKTIVLDLNGKTLTGNITGTGTLKGMDSTNNDYKGNGKIVGTVAAGLAETMHKFVDGTVTRNYLALTDETTGETSFHRVYLKITSTMLRPDYKLNGEYAPGIYYKVTIAGDEAVLDAIGTYGVAIGKDEVPESIEPGSNASAMELTAEQKAMTATAITGNGTMLAGIMKENNDVDVNVKNATETTICGVPYITLTSGETIMGATNEIVFAGALSNAYDMWKAENHGGLTEAQIDALDEMHGAFDKVMEKLNLSKPNA